MVLHGFFLFWKRSSFISRNKNSIRHIRHIDSTPIEYTEVMEISDYYQFLIVGSAVIVVVVFLSCITKFAIRPTSFEDTLAEQRNGRWIDAFEGQRNTGKKSSKSKKKKKCSSVDHDQVKKIENTAERIKERQSASKQSNVENGKVNTVRTNGTNADGRPGELSTQHAQDGAISVKLSKDKQEKCFLQLQDSTNSLYNSDQKQVHQKTPATVPVKLSSRKKKNLLQQQHRESINNVSKKIGLADKTDEITADETSAIPASVGYGDQKTKQKNHKGDVSARASVKCYGTIEVNESGISSVIYNCYY